MFSLKILGSDCSEEEEEEDGRNSDGDFWVCDMNFFCVGVFPKCVWRHQNYDEERWVGGWKGYGVQFCSDCSEERGNGGERYRVLGRWEAVDVEFWGKRLKK